MSYCRWSSDNGKSDLYCYESASGFVTHVAGNKPVGDAPEMPDIRACTIDEYNAAGQRRSDFLENCERRPIGLAHDGETFTDPDLEAFRERIVGLSAMGYHVPSYVLPKIDEEMQEDEVFNHPDMFK